MERLCGDCGRSYDDAERSTICPHDRFLPPHAVVTWQAFVLAYGWRARADHLEHILDVQAAEVIRLRGRAPAKQGPRRTFADLFALWHGRPPREDEWLKPRRRHNGAYEWLAPESTRLASLVGTVSKADIIAQLTARLRSVTGDPTATRSAHSVQVAITRIGLQVSDVIAGITVAAAARETGSRSILEHEIRKGRLQTFRVGRYHVIPHAGWQAWKAERSFAPAGWWRLAKLKDLLGIKSDKLSEWARQGFIPRTVRVNGYGFGKSTRWGTWYIDPKTAKKLVADRRAGRPMPWHGQPEIGNLRTTWRLLERRRHPEACETCRGIWGEADAPRTFEDYVRRYPPLAHGAKRHLTRPWSPGITVQALARETAVSASAIVNAIHRGALRARKYPGIPGWRISRTDATRWKARRCPNGESPRSWIALATAARYYGFSQAELRDLVDSGALRHRIGAAGAALGITYVLKQQCAELRERFGFSEREAARRVGVSVARLRVLLRGLDWREADRIPLDTVNALKKRQASEHGVTLQEAARTLRKPLSWVREEIARGTVRPLRTAWDRKRLYISAPMFERLRRAARLPRRRIRWSADWLYLSDASTHAGVTTGTVMKWERAGTLRLHRHPAGKRYHRRSIEARARLYWDRENRFKRATPPAWLQERTAS